jgi:hypothetical protein
VPELSTLLAALGLSASEGCDLPSSEKRFPDGAHYRIEIPSTEGPRCLEAVLDEAQQLDVPVLRVSQGSGAMMLTESELTEMAARAASEGIEVSVFARPGADWLLSGTTRAPGGGAYAPASHGSSGLIHGINDIMRAADAGFRSVLVADIGLLSAFGILRGRGDLPATMQAKVSALFPVTNPATARVLADLGASTLNVATDLSLAQMAMIRASVDLPLDVYLEAPEALGAWIRLPEVAEIIRVAAPVYIKFGLANGPSPYPSGYHLEKVAIQQSRERVRRARLALELLESAGGAELRTSESGAAGLAVPEPQAPRPEFRRYRLATPAAASDTGATG